MWKQRFYIGDLLPTLAAAAGIELNPKLKLDGLNLWSALKYGYESVEREILHNIDDIFNYTSFTKGKWKLVNGTTNGGVYDYWLGVPRSTHANSIDPRSAHYTETIQNSTVWQYLSPFNAQTQGDSDIEQLRLESAVNCQFVEPNNELAPCNASVAACLFDLDLDPCEQNNLFEKYENSSILQDMLERLQQLRSGSLPPLNKAADERANPALHNGEWTWWEEAKSMGSKSTLFSCLFLMSIFVQLYSVMLF